MIKTNHSYPRFMGLVSALTGLMTFLSFNVSAQETVEWTTLGNDFAHTRSTSADQITAENFSDLEVAWEWDGASFEAQSG